MTIQLTLTLKRVGEGGGGGGVVNLTPSVVFPKLYILEQGGVHKI